MLWRSEVGRDVPEEPVDLAHVVENLDRPEYPPRFRNYVRNRLNRMIQELCVPCGALEVAKSVVVIP